MSVKIKSFKFLLSFISVGILVYHLINLFLFWPDIPDRIAIHFTNGEPDNWGSKFFVLIMPIIGLLLWWLIGLFTKHPEKLNYINLTEKNREKQYNMSKKMMIFIQHLVLIISILANESFIRYSVGIENSVLNFFPLILTAIMLLAVFYNLIWAARLKE
ncbi:putative membrane protein [Metabacillus crassostreae]|uniref:DUF1648 domain-containing protein n=1 Tax=Metabacillus crassostreae TaxID=929098 RepID=UPI00195A3622|nr:DUF1648 domain-containing protein [Metabacillus crassostreae]MBM7602764.1 putative membrane protein [Metabacillus crassostreae]